MTSNLNGTTDTRSEKSDPEKESGNQDELQKVSDFFEANAGAIERWLREKAPDDVINKINSIAARQCEKEHRSSVTSELYQQWLSSSNTPLKVSTKTHSHTKKAFWISNFSLLAAKIRIISLST